MILLRELMGRDSYSGEIGELRIWDIDAESISPSVIAAAYYRMRQFTSDEVAASVALRIADAVFIAHQSGQINNSTTEHFKLMRPPMLSGDFRICLESMREPYRRCIFFALSMDMPIENAVSLTWPTYVRMQENGYINHNAEGVVDSMPRHFRDKSVFWDYERGVAGSLSRVRFEAEMTFGCTFEVLQEKFNKMALCDPAANAETIRELLTRSL